MGDADQSAASAETDTTQTTAAAPEPVAEPAAERPGLDPELAGRIAQLRGQAAPEPQEPGEGAAEAATAETSSEQPEQDPWEAPRPSRPKSIADRLHRKATRAESEAEQLRQRLQQLEQQYEKVTRSQQEANEQFQELMSKGDIDGALKVKGLSPLQQLNQEHLRRQGALPPRDPKTEALERELRELKEQRAKEQQTRQQQLEQQRRQQEYTQLVEDTRAEIEGLELPGAKELAAVPGFADFTIKTLLQAEDELSLQDAAKLARAEFKPLYEALHKAFGQPARSGAKQSVVTPDRDGASHEQSPTQPGAGAEQPRARRKPPAVIPQNTAADATGPTKRETPQERFARIKARLNAL